MMSKPTVIPNHQQSQQVCAYLRGLPDAEPPAALRDRVLSAMPLPRSRAPRAAAALLVAACLAAVAMFARLDNAVVAPVPTPLAYPGSAAQARLRALDRDLQAALQRDAGQARLDVLWAEREAVIAQLNSPTPAVPVRL